MATTIKSKEEVVLEDNELVCILTGEVKKIKAKNGTSEKP